MVKSPASEQSRKKIISSVMNSHTKIVRPVSCFVLKSSSEFTSRSVDVFSSLNTLENKHQTWVSNNETHETFDDSNNHERVQDTKDVFKKPFAPLPIKRKTTHISRNRRNMKKWIKYSLADVPLSSDATNSAVAFQFLSELRKKKEAEETGVTSSTDEKLVFCKPKKKKRYSKTCNSNVASSSVSGSDSITSDRNSQCLEKFSCQNGEDKPNVNLMHLQDDFNDA